MNIRPDGPEAERKERGMLRIGFVDHYLDEWHANNYPRFIREAAAQMGLEAQVVMAYAECDRPDDKQGMSSREWSQAQGIPLAASLEELTAACDGVMVMAPSFPHRHYDLARPALEAGKPVYVDKIFAPSEEEGKRIFDLAARHGAPIFSSSALRFDAALDAFRGKGDASACWCLTCGPNVFKIYAIHQIEMLETVMGRAQRVKALGNEGGRTLIFDFGGGRMGQMTQMSRLPFQLSVSDGRQNVYQAAGTDFFSRLVRAILAFFVDKKPPIAPENTLNALAMLTAAQTAMTRQDVWIDV